MTDQQIADNSKIGFFGLLTLLFIALKLTGVIKWSWWLVLLPSWGGIAFLLLVLVIALVAAAVFG